MVAYQVWNICSGRFHYTLVAVMLDLEVIEELIIEV